MFQPCQASQKNIPPQHKSDRVDPLCEQAIPNLAVYPESEDRSKQYQRRELQGEDWGNLVEEAVNQKITRQLGGIDQAKVNRAGADKYAALQALRKEMQRDDRAGG